MNKKEFIKTKQEILEVRIQGLKTQVKIDSINLNKIIEETFNTVDIIILSERIKNNTKEIQTIRREIEIYDQMLMLMQKINNERRRLISPPNI